tara:strand:+ start:48 stop:236 length:189 start_codon:yes stop_codon:yes gene_type:complete
MSNEKELGMYAIATAPEGKLTIGKYELIRQDDNSIWIQCDDGGQFPESALEKVIDKYYKGSF